MIFMWQGIPLEMTKEVAAAFPFHFTYEEFPTHCCGAGHGLEEWLVPDYIIGPGVRIKISPACTGHDLGWDKATPTWDAFHAENSRLYTNIKAIEEYFTKAGSRARQYAQRWPAIYSGAVNTVGAVHFWRLKQEQGYQIPQSAAWLL